jgi:hypothetical protein
VVFARTGERGPTVAPSAQTRTSPPCRSPGERRTGARFGPTRLERLENDQLTEIETSSEQRPGDALIEALKAPVVARFASFLGQPPIRATLTWTVPDRRITITGKRGDQPFEEVIFLIKEVFDLAGRTS